MSSSVGRDDLGSEPRPAPEEKRRFPFYVGTIVRVNYAQGTGVLRSASGREIRFVAPFVELLGGRRFRDLVEGMEVGFDVGWTSKGLRVTRIKIVS
jgi:cold shock CspA family protein